MRNNPIVRAIVQIATTIILTAALGPAGAAIGATLAQVGAAAAALSATIVTGLSGGNLGQALRAGAIAGATAFAFNAVGDATNAFAGANPGPAGQHGIPDFMSDAHLVNIGGHALVGCGSSVAAGGSCGSGALSGAVTSFAGPMMKGQSFEVRLVASATLGGVASVAGGGTFANGAVTGAFGYLFNELGAAAIKKLYDLRGSIFSRDLKGHHKFPESLANKYDELISGDAMNAAATDRIGQGYVSRGFDGDPHSGLSAPHRAADAAIDQKFLEFASQNGITRDNPMSVGQYHQFMGEVQQIPSVGSYWKGIDTFVESLTQKGIQPKLRGMPRYRGYFAE